MPRWLPWFWLIHELCVYLKGFLKRIIQPEMGQNQQKCRGGKFEDQPFTILALTMMGAYAK
jgi:hypothetical protein